MVSYVTSFDLNKENGNFKLCNFHDVYVLQKYSELTQ